MKLLNIKLAIAAIFLLYSCKDTERVERAKKNIFNDGFTACYSLGYNECLCCMVVNTPTGSETCDERSKFTMTCEGAKKIRYRIINKITITKVKSGE